MNESLPSKNQPGPTLLDFSDRTRTGISRLSSCANEKRVARQIGTEFLQPPFAPNGARFEETERGRAKKGDEGVSGPN